MGDSFHNIHIFPLEIVDVLQQACIPFIMFGKTKGATGPSFQRIVDNPLFSACSTLSPTIPHPLCSKEWI
jgi:hypothetical protein